MFCFASGWSVDKDGPGQRYIVYLKGCNMRCTWCANPESISRKTEVLFYPDRNTFPLDYACPFQAVKNRIIDRNKCALCDTYECVYKWKNRCFEIAGFNITPQELAEKVISEKDLFGHTGGITFGGGEPTLQADEIIAVLKLLQPEGIHTAIETNASTEGFRKLIGKVDLIIADLKCVSAEKHKNWVGIDNKKVLDNLCLAAKKQQELIIRIPLVQGLNTDDSEMDKICAFLGEIVKLRGSLTVDILRMHHMGKPKYSALDMDYPAKELSVPNLTQLEKLSRKLINHGITIQ